MKRLSSLPAVACPVCEATTSDIYLKEVDEALYPSAIGSSRNKISPSTILRRRLCRFGFRQMRSSPEQLRELYRQMDPKVYESELAGRDRTAHRDLQIVHRHVRTGRLLDVGCASGLFLLHALNAGWKVAGIEPNEQLCKEAQKSLNGKGEVQCATLETARLEGGFDAITLWDVLEHVPEPLTFPQACRQLLQPHGYLFLNVPDLGSWEARTLGHRWPLLLPEHLNYFSRKSLKLCAERVGFTAVQFGRRRAWFSIRYVAYRVAQRSIPGSALLRKTTQSSLGKLLIPVSLGEIFAVLRARRQPK